MTDDCPSQCFYTYICLELYFCDYFIKSFEAFALNLELKTGTFLFATR